MTRSRAALLILLVLLGLAAASCGGEDDEASTTTEATPATTEASSGGTTLEGSVGPGFVISLDGTDGLAAGSYTLVVDDQSAAHNFHLTGPGGIDVSTDLGGTGEESFEVELQAGEYTFLCDPHASQMRGSFTVG